MNSLQGFVGHDVVGSRDMEADAISVASQKAFNYHSIEKKVLKPYANILKLVCTFCFMRTISILTHEIAGWFSEINDDSLRAKWFLHSLCILVTDPRSAL